MASSTKELTFGPLTHAVEVIGFVLLTGMAWINSAELLITTFLTFKRWSGRYFYCLVVTTLGVLVYQTNVFLMIFAPQLNIYGILFILTTGWVAMSTGQALVLWSRLHLICRSRLKLRLVLGMIIVNAVCMQSPQFVFCLLAVKNNIIDPTYKPFAIMEKIAVIVLSTQEVIISIIYMVAAIRILRAGETLHRKSNNERIKLLFLANFVIICLDVCVVVLEYLGPWGIWCSFKGFAYSVKLKIEFAILNQLRDSVHASSGGRDSYDCNTNTQDNNGGISLRTRDQHVKSSGQPSRLSLKRNVFEEIVDKGRIEKTTEIEIRHNEQEEQAAMPQQHHGVTFVKSPPSESSSEIDFAGRGS